MLDNNNKEAKNILSNLGIMQKYRDVLLKVRQQPILIAGVIGFVLISSLVFSRGESVKKHELSNESVEFEEEKDHMTGVKEAVDPRDVWTAKVEQAVVDSNKDFSTKLEEIKESKNSEIATIKKEFEELKALLVQQKELMERKELEESLSRSNPIKANESNYVLVKKKSLGGFSKEYSNKKKNIKEYITSGSFARAVLMTGVVVGTGSNSQSNPEPIMLRLTDFGIFSKGKKTEQIKEAILIGDCSGDLSSERAKCRLQTLSLENYKGEIIERPVKGWIVGEDGRYGVKGTVVDKSSDMMRMAMLNGVLGGMSKFLENQATKSVFPVSPISGQQNALSSVDQLKGGVASGAGNAFSKMADFVMERFNSMSPQIAVASGREVDVVFQHGVDLNGESDSSKDNQQVPDSNFNQNTLQNKQHANYGTDALNETLQQMNQGIEGRGTNDSF